MHVSIVNEKKKRKRDLLLAAAFELFVEKGPGETAIDDIVRRAGVAKGTFYLYFRDRAEILQYIVAQKGALLLHEAYLSAQKRSPASLEDEIVYTIEELLDREQRSPKLISLIYKNFSWQLMSAALAQLSPGSGGAIAKLIAREGREEAERLLFMIMELVSSVAYNGIILEEPQGMAAMRPSLLSAVRRLLKEDA